MIKSGHCNGYPFRLAQQLPENMQKYECIRTLGEGSFGKVYLVRNKIEKRLYCLKYIKLSKIPIKEREACKLEVALLQRLKHPNIVGYIESFTLKNETAFCIVMTYCDGGDLSSHIAAAKMKKFEEKEILQWFVQIALGLHHMHENNILHRDLKTQNIFLLGNGRLVLGDLGISKPLSGTLDFANTCIGTPYYMSPEVFSNKPYNHKSDIWSLGCVLYEMTALKHAFNANSLKELAYKISKGRYPPIDTKYSSGLRELIMSMLVQSPSQRPSLAEILMKPFIKKHIYNFFVDIVSRPVGKFGDGTLCIKEGIIQAVQNSPHTSQIPQTDGNSYPGNTELIESLRKQLQSLGMQDLIEKVLNPKKVPITETNSRKVVKEQRSALKREESRKKSVETALDKLRKERELRLRMKQEKLQKELEENKLPSNVVNEARVIAQKKSNESAKKLQLPAEQVQKQEKRVSGVKKSPNKNYVTTGSSPKYKIVVAEPAALPPCIIGEAIRYSSIDKGAAGARAKDQNKGSLQPNVSGDKDDAKQRVLMRKVEKIKEKDAAQLALFQAAYKANEQQRVLLKGKGDAQYRVSEDFLLPPPPPIVPVLPTLASEESQSTHQPIQGEVYGDHHSSDFQKVDETSDIEICQGKSKSEENVRALDDQDQDDDLHWKSDQEEENEEVIKKYEAELTKELELSSVRCDDLREAIAATKAAGRVKNSPSSHSREVESDQSSLNTSDEETSMGDSCTESPRHGRLSDRIRVLRKKCLEALGQEAFDKLYSAIKRDGIAEQLGENKDELIEKMEELIFMEESHTGLEY